MTELNELLHNITVVLADKDIDAEFIVNTVRRPNEGDVIGEYGQWEKVFDDAKSLLEFYNYPLKEYSEDELQTIANEHNCVISEDGDVWEKLNAGPARYVYPWTDDFIEYDDERIFQITYGELIKKIPEENIDFFITDSECLYYQTRDDVYEFEEEWPFHEDTIVYLLHS